MVDKTETIQKWAFRTSVVISHKPTSGQVKRSFRHCSPRNRRKPIAEASVRLTKEEYGELASVPKLMGSQENNADECEILVMCSEPRNIQ
jgi:hypothetical protein